ncbi:uncharacterized protein LOC117340448 [Pecten maximus]|uniref:uncharacterized protein LOC117340448 n=1 Tax=Pecten maximus TaxID=6579 RepID=UPI00145913B8|nr:uncharacterized protein LOC117340448 [Pecten maximus]
MTGAGSLGPDNLVGATNVPPKVSAMQTARDLNTSYTIEKEQPIRIPVTVTKMKVKEVSLEKCPDDDENQRLGQTCNHIAGLLFRVEAANKMGVTSCTSAPCSWNIPGMGKKIVQPLQVKDMQLTKTKHNTKPGKRRPFIMNATNTSFNPVSSTPNISHLQPLTNQLRKEIPTACIFKGLDMPIENPAPPQKSSFDMSIYTMNTIAANFKAMATQQFQGGEDQFINSIPKVSPSDIHTIEEETRGQSTNDDWKALRKGRITSSNFHSVHTKMKTLQRDPTADVNSLCNTLLGNTKMPLDHVRSIKHGRETEPLAKKDFVKSFSLQHQNITLGNVASSCVKNIHFFLPLQIW